MMSLFDRKRANELFYESYQQTKCFEEAIRHVDGQFREMETNETTFIELFPPNNLHKAVEGRLCHCRGMVQDVSLEPMLYKGTPDLFYASGEATEDDGTFVDVILYYVIPVPCNDHFYSINESEDAATPQGSSPYASERRRPRCDDEEGPESTKLDVALKQRAAGFCTEAQRAVKNNTLQRMDPIQTQEQYLNLPYPATSKSLCTACIIMVPIQCNNSGMRDRIININDVVDFYGFLHFPDDQTYPGILEEDEFAQFASWHAAELSKGLVSRLFCVSYRHLREALSVPKCLSQASFSFEKERGICKRYLKREVCGGDSLLADYLLLHLATKVSGHHEMTPIGDIPLLVTSKLIEPRIWSERIAKITPVAEVFLDEKLLCSSKHSLGPIYDYERNYIKTGLFQVANGSHITVDCTHLPDIGSQGKECSQWSDLLFDLIHKQKLSIDYKYHTVPILVDLAFLALYATDNASVHPILKFPLRIIWEPQSTSSSTPSDAAASDSEMSLIRRYFARTHHLTPSMSDENNIQEKVVEAMMSLTEMFPKWNNRDPLVHNNAFSAVTALFRAQALSLGRDAVNEEDIEFVTSLEKKRMERM